MNWIKSVDLDQIKNQMAEMKDQLQELRFRKPWSKGNDTTPMLYMALGGALAWAGIAIYNNRKQVASFCSNRGAKLKDTWEQSGLKEKAGRMMNRGKDGQTVSSAPGAGTESQF